MKREGSITRKWFRSMLAVIVAILCVAFILDIYLLQMMSGNVLQMSGDMSRRMQKTFDSRLDEIRRNTVLLELNNTNARLKRLSQAPSTNMKEIYQFCDQLFNFRASSNLVKRAFLYYPAIHCVASDIGFYPEVSYFSLMSLYPDNIFNDWKPDEQKNLTTQFVVVNSAGVNHLLFLRPMKLSGAPVGLIVVEIDAQSLMGAMGAYGEIGESLSFLGLIVDKQIAFSIGAPEALSALNEAALQMPSTEGSVQSRGITAYVCPSAYPSLSFVSGFVQRNLFRAIYSAGALCFAGILLCLAMGVVLSLTVSRRNAKPLVNILQKFSDKATGELDEYQYISGKIDQMFSNKSKAEQKLHEQQILIDGLFLHLVLQGGLKEELQIFSAAKRCDVLFENPIYQMAVVDCAQPQGIGDELPGVLDRMGFYALVTSIEGRTAILFNVETALDQQAAGWISEAIHERLHCPASIGFGLGYDLLGRISASYAEALAALPPLPDQNRSEVALYAMRLPSEAELRIQSQKARDEIVQSLRADPCEKALDALDGAFEACFAGNPSEQDAQQSMDEIREAALHALEKKSAESGQAFGRLVKQLHGAQNPRTLKGCVIRALRELLGVKSPAEKKPTPSVPERARELIDQNLNDPMLGLYLLSERLRVSNAYLSSCFKSRFGVGVVQYINEARVENAKRLILSTDMSVKEIALQVGFSSDISFIRVFKKYEAKTPTELRRNGKSEADGL